MHLELFCRHWIPHQAGEVNSMLLTSLQTPEGLEPVGWWCWLPITSPPTNQKIVHELTTPCSLNTVKLLTTPLQRALALCGPICLAKQESSPFLLHPRLCLHVSIWHRGTEAEVQQHTYWTRRTAPPSLHPTVLSVSDFFTVIIIFLFLSLV